MVTVYSFLGDKERPIRSTNVIVIFWYHQVRMRAYEFANSTAQYQFLEDETFTKENSSSLYGTTSVTAWTEYTGTYYNPKFNDTFFKYDQYDPRIHGDTNSAYTTMRAQVKSYLINKSKEIRERS